MIKTKYNNALIQLQLNNNNVHRVYYADNNLIYKACPSVNLLLNSKREESNSNSCIAAYDLAETPVEGETYTFTLWGKISENRTHFAPFNSGYYIDLVKLKEIENGVYSGTFKWTNKHSNPEYNIDIPTSIRVYAIPNNSLFAGTVYKAKLEKGENPYPIWSPAACETENLLINSNNKGNGWNNSLYPIVGDRQLTEPSIEGGIYTFTIWGELGAKQNKFDAYNSGDMVSFGTCSKIASGVYSLIFAWNNTNQWVTTPVSGKGIRVYAIPGTSSGNTTASIVHKVKLEKGINYNPVYSIAPNESENLLLNTDRVVTNGTYNMAQYDLSETPIVDETYTITLWGKLAETKSSFQLFHNDGNTRLAILKKIEDGIYSCIFKWNNTNNPNPTRIRIYQFTVNQTGTSIINKIKLEKGAQTNPKYS